MSESCHNPICEVPIEERRQGWRRTPRRFCSDRCKRDAWALRKVAALLLPLGMAPSWEILKAAVACSPSSPEAEGNAR
jgi:hypothetical protein